MPESEQLVAAFQRRVYNSLKAPMAGETDRTCDGYSPSQ